jgi:hypothetical protein
MLSWPSFQIARARATEPVEISYTSMYEKRDRGGCDPFVCSTSPAPCSAKRSTYRGTRVRLVLQWVK